MSSTPRGGRRRLTIPLMSAHPAHSDLDPIVCLRSLAYAEVRILSAACESYGSRRFGKAANLFPARRRRRGLSTRYGAPPAPSWSGRTCAPPGAERQRRPPGSIRAAGRRSPARSCWRGRTESPARGIPLVSRRAGFMPRPPRRAQRSPPSSPRSSSPGGPSFCRRAPKPSRGRSVPPPSAPSPLVHRRPGRRRRHAALPSPQLAPRHRPPPTETYQAFSTPVHHRQARNTWTLLFGGLPCGVWNYFNGAKRETPGRPLAPGAAHGPSLSNPWSDREKHGPIASARRFLVASAARAIEARAAT